MMKIDILTLFPEMFTPLNSSIMKQAQEVGAVEIELHNFRENAVNKHGHVDDYPYGGGAGMLLRVEPIVETLETLKLDEGARIILVDPIGKPFSQEIAQELSTEDHLVFICGHYEGYDERIRSYVTDEISVGDYVLTNGELPAMIMIDATVRLIPEVVGNEESIIDESHQNNFLEYPQYTRPQNFRGEEVPEVLLSGHHAKIEEWRHKESVRRTYKRRPDLIEKADLSDQEEEWLAEFKEENN